MAGGAASSALWGECEPHGHFPPGPFEVDRRGDEPRLIALVNRMAGGAAPRVILIAAACEVELMQIDLTIAELRGAPRLGEGGVVAGEAQRVVGDIKGAQRHLLIHQLDGMFVGGTVHAVACAAFTVRDRTVRG